MIDFNEKKGIHPAIKIGAFVGVVVLVIAGIGLSVAQPFCSPGPPTEQQIPEERLREHVSMLSEKLVPRDHWHTNNLDQCAAYIADHFKQAGAAVEMQEFEANDRVYKNVIATFGPATPSRIVVGAHYDAYGELPGADDNASGVAGLIELGYLLGQADLQQQVELVAFTLEEPPYFRTENMGSARYALGLHQAEVDIEAMICLEMIGFFSDEKNSQRFPSALLKLFYPNRGNYIAVVGSTGDRKLIQHVKGSMKGATDLPVYSMCASKTTRGLDFSDHLNFWDQGYNAVMITDTAFFRNVAYHSNYDTLPRLDFDRMAKVVLGVYEAVVQLADPSEN